MALSTVHHILSGRRLIRPSSHYVTFKVELVEQIYLVGVIGLILNLF